jgi:hypothetical protein
VFSMAKGCAAWLEKWTFFGGGMFPSCLRSSFVVVDNGVGKLVLAIAVVSGVSPWEGSAECCLPTSCHSATGASMIRVGPHPYKQPGELSWPWISSCGLRHAGMLSHRNR